MEFRIKGLSPEPFRPLFGLSDAELAARGIVRRVSDGSGFPDRIGLVDAAAGETLLLLNYTHQPAATPYRAAHAIYVREADGAGYDRVGEVPDMLRRRTISLRAFDAAGMIVDAELAEGTSLEAPIARLLALDEVSYIHAHFAKFGCYAARIERA